MSDLSQLSDADLLRLYQQGPQPASPQPASPLSQMSDEDLLRLYQGQGQGQAPAPQPEEPQYDAMGNPTGTTAPAAPAPTMSYGDQMGNVGHFYSQLVRKYSNNLSFGLADKAAAGMDYLTGSAPSYDEALKQERAQSAEADKNPLAPVAGAAGMLTTGGGLVRNGISLLPYLRGAGFLAKVGAGAIEGGAYGAADRMGHTDGNLSDYADAAARGGASGAFVGAALPAAGGIIGKAYEFASPYVSRVMPDVSRGASWVLGNAATADRAGLQSLGELGPEAMVVDAGPSFKGLGMGVANTPGEGASALANALDARFKGREGRLVNDVDNVLGPDQSPVQLHGDIQATKQSVTAPLFQAGYGGSVPVPPGLAERPAVARALRDASDVAANEGNPLPTVVRDDTGQIVPNDAAATFEAGSRQRVDAALGNLLGNGGQLETADQIIARRAAEAGPLYDAARAAEVPVTDEMTALLPRLQRAGVFDQAAQKMSVDGQPFDIGRVDAWDYMKRALDDRIGSAVRSGANDDARIYQGLKRELTGAIDTAVPAWGQARQTFAGHSDMLEALEAGRQAAAPNVTREQVARDYGALTPGEQEMYRLGFGNSLREKLARASDNADMPHVVAGNQQVRDKISAIAPSQGAADAFNAAIANEGRAFTEATAPNPQAWKRAFDVLNERASRASGPEAEGLGAARNDLRTALEQNPDFRQALNRSDYYDRVSSAVDQGQKVLSTDENAIRPEDLAAQWAAMSPGERAAMFKGVRSDIGRRLGTQANDLSALKKTLGGEYDWNRDKMGLVFGPEARDSIVGSINREQKFSDTYADILRNSRTGPSQAAQQQLEKAGSPFNASASTTPTGLAIKTGQKLAGALLGFNGQAVRDEVGQVLAAGGPQRDALVQALLTNAVRRQSSRAAIEGTVNNPALLKALSTAYARQNGQAASQ